MTGWWYELDGFVMREEERHKFAKKLKTIGENVISDHRPKKMVVDVRKKKWRREYVKRRTPRIKWEMLKEEAVEKPLRPRSVWPSHPLSSPPRFLFEERPLLFLLFLPLTTAPMI